MKDWVEVAEAQNILRSQSLEERDEDLHNLIKLEEQRQAEGLELIASENFTSAAVRECLGSCLTNKYSEGSSDQRFYGGNEIIDKIENLCKERALQAFRLSPEDWHVNVQPYSGSPANLAAIIALCKPHDRIMGLSLSSGGHLTHGFYSDKRSDVTAIANFFESLPYTVGENGFIDYDDLESLSLRFRPKLIICGYSAYPRDLDYPRFRSIADGCGAKLLCDMSHFGGFVAAGLMANPFEYCDVVTSTTHKTLRGPRSGIIFCRSKYKKAVEDAVFPGSCMGGPHDHQIAAVATQMKEVMTENFAVYMEQVHRNAVVLCDELKKLGHKICTGGTDNHIVMVDLKPMGLTGGKVEKMCERVGISINKNSVPGDKSAVSPSGIRLGTPSLTTRGMGEEEMKRVALLLNEAMYLAQKIQYKSGKKLSDFMAALDDFDAEINELSCKVKNFAVKFPL